MTTIRDVAARAGVSRSTVSRVINDDPAVLKPVREAVLRAIEELDYRPSPSARSLRSGKTQTIGILVGDLRVPSAVDALVAAGEIADENGYVLLFGNSGGDRDVEAKHLRSFLDRRVDGLLWARIDPTEEHEAILAGARDTVVVVVGGAETRLPGTTMLPDSPAFAEVADEAARNGHRRVAFIGDQRSFQWKNNVQRHLDAAGITSVDRLAASHLNCGPVVEELFSQPEPPTLIFARSALIGGVLLALRNYGLEVPRDVSVVCAGHAVEAETTIPPVDVIDDDPEEHARKALQILFGLMRKDESTPPRIAHEWRYIRRGCIGPARA